MNTKKQLAELTAAIKRGLSSYYAQEDGEPVFFINIRDINDGKVDVNTVERIKVKETDALDKSRIEQGDIIISIKGSTFKTAVADESVKDFVISANLIALKLNHKVLPEIVAAYLTSKEGQKELQSRSAGSIQKSLNLKSLMSITIPIPPIEKQKAIAEYFSLLIKYNELLQKEQEIRKEINDAIIQNYMKGE